MNEGLKIFYDDYMPDYSGIRGFDGLLNAHTWKGTEYVLDIGCGGGFDAKLASKLASDVLAIDVYDKMLMYACKNNQAKNIYYLHGDFMLERFKENCFDVIVCNWMVFQIDDKKLFFDRVHRFLKPDGVLLLSDTWVLDETLIKDSELFFEPKENYKKHLSIFSDVTDLGDTEQSNVFFRINLKATK